MKTQDRTDRWIGSVVAIVGVLVVGGAVHGAELSERELVSQVNKRLTKGRVVSVQPARQEVQVIPERLLRMFGGDPSRADLFETTPPGLPVVTIEIPNDEAIAAGLVGPHGMVASGGRAEAYVFYQPHDSGNAFFMKADDTDPDGEGPIPELGTWATQMIFGPDFEPGVTELTGYDLLVYNSTWSVNASSFKVELWDGDPFAIMDVTCNAGTASPIPGTLATFSDLPQAEEACPPQFGQEEPTCVGLYRLRATLPAKVTVDCDRVWMVVTMTDGCRSGWRIAGTDDDVFNAPAEIGFSDGLWLFYACEQFGVCGTANGYKAGTCCYNGTTVCDHTDGEYECDELGVTGGVPTFCGDGHADYYLAWTGDAPEYYNSLVGSVFAATDLAFTLQPKRAIGKPGDPDVEYEIIGNEIKLVRGGANVELEWQVSDYSPACIKAFHSHLDASAFQGTLQEKLVPCQSDQDCRDAFGGVCSVTGGPCVSDADCVYEPPVEECQGSKCILDPAERLYGFCAPAFAFTGRPDWILRGTSAIGAAGVNTLEYGIGWVIGAAADPVCWPSNPPAKGQYMATMWVHVPPEATGTFTLNLAVGQTGLVDANSQFIPLPGLVPAQVTVETGKCCGGIGAHDKKQACIDDLTKDLCDLTGVCKGSCVDAPPTPCAGDAECVKATGNPDARCSGGSMLGLPCLVYADIAEPKGLLCDVNAGERCVSQGSRIFSPGEVCASPSDSCTTGKCCYNLDAGRACADAVTAEECDALPGPSVFRLGELCAELAEPCGCVDAPSPRVADCCRDAGNGINPRYLSFRAGRFGDPQAIRVTFKDLPAPYDTWNGLSMWVGPPAEYCENSGQNRPPPEGCGPAPGMPSSTFVAATLRCEPYYTDWSLHETIHVFHEGIVPEGTYEIEGIDALCDPSVGEAYSMPLALTTSRWGDLVQDCMTPLCGPPDGSVDVATDVLALVDKYRNASGAPMQIRADLVHVTGASLPDQRTTVREFIVALDAFRGSAFPFSPGPVPCAK